MCIFCAAIPMSAAMGARIAGKQHEQRQVSGETAAARHIPMGKIAVAVTGGLIVCSAVYHVVIVPHIGVVI